MQPFLIAITLHRWRLIILLARAMLLFQLSLSGSQVVIAGIKYLSGSTDYGISCVTGATERHTPNGPLVPFTTYDTRTRIAKIILAKGYGGGTAGTNSNFSLGSLSASSTKRWVRLDSCRFNKQIATVNWTGKYNWQSNNNISVAWRQYGGQFSLQSTFVTDLPYGVAEFGAGA